MKNLKVKVLKNSELKSRYDEIENKLNSTIALPIAIKHDKF